MPTDPGHPALPLTLNPVTGTLATVAQDSLSEVRQCARAILSTPLGRRIETPALGLPDPRWRTSVNTDQIQQALDDWEPRATWAVASDPVTGATVGVTVTGVL